VLRHEAVSAVAPRAECPRCLRPEVACYCAHLSLLDTRTRVLVLSHPREYGNPVGTARMATLCLPNSHIAVGVEFARDREVMAELADPARPPVLLYPGPGARDLATEPPPGPCTLVVVDGTWHHARSMVRRNAFLRQLPCYAFTPEAPSEYRIRREPRAECVSTLEALVSALGMLEGDAERFRALLAPFRAMVDFQLEHAGRSDGGRKRARRRVAAPVASRLPPELTAPNLVCVSGEANAWPYDRARRAAPYPHELVHWLAVRTSDGERFERVLAPRQPLGRSPLVHSRLTEDELRAGSSIDELAASWRRFLRPDDVLCCWGPYPVELLIQELGPLEHPFVDLRKVAGDYVKSRAGSIEQRVAGLGLTNEPCGHGRGGERLGLTLALTRWLAERAVQVS
jgi:DTW domain-containing protein YfiP